MKLKEGTFHAVDNAQLYYQAHVPSSSPKAAVIVVHGHGDHSGGLRSIFENLTTNNYAACGFDLRGHGKSSGTRGFIRKWDEYRNDLHSFRKIVRSEFPDLPLFIVAHSLGGVISLEYGLHHAAGIAGLIAIAPAISYEMKVFEKILVSLMARIKPDFTVKQPSNPHQLTRDSELISKLKADGLRHNTVTPGLGRGLSRTIPLLKKQAHAITFPLLFQYGLADEITPPTKLRQFFDSVGSQDKVRFEYEYMRHRPFDELGQEQFFVDMLTWLDRHTNR